MKKHFSTGVLLAVLLLAALFCTGCPSPSGVNPVEYAVTVNASGAATGESVTAPEAVAAGEPVTLTVAVNSGRRVTLSGPMCVNPKTINSPGGSATFTMPAEDVTVTATFSDIPATYVVGVTPNGAAADEFVVVDPSTAEAGETVTLTAMLNSGRQLELSASGITFTPEIIDTDGGTATFTMPAENVMVTATFSDIIYNVTVTAINPASGESLVADPSTAAAGETVTLTATLNSGRQVALSADDIEFTPDIIDTDQGTAEFTMPAGDVTVTATFSDIPTYTVTVNAIDPDSGESLVANPATVAAGEMVTLTATLNPGRQVVLSADGIIFTPDTIDTNGGTATFTMPAEDVTVTATFSDIMYTITINEIAPEAGESVVADVTTAKYGDTVTLTATLNSSRQVKLSGPPSITIIPSLIALPAGGTGTATFTMPAEDVTVEATFQNFQ